MPAAVPFDEALPECQRHPPQASRRHRKPRGAAGDFLRFNAVRRPVAPGAAVPSRAPPSSTFLPCLVLNVRLPHGGPRMTLRKHGVVIRRRRTIHGRLAEIMGKVSEKPGSPSFQMHRCSSELCARVLSSMNRGVRTGDAARDVTEKKILKDKEHQTLIASIAVRTG